MKAKNTTALRDIDAPLYGYWQALYASFYDSAFYVDVAKRWKRLSLAYLLLLMFIIFLPFSLKAISLGDYFEQKVLYPIQHLPTLYVQDGEISINEPMPWLVKDDKGIVRAIVDTSGKIKDFPKSYPEMTLLVTKKEFFYKMPPPPEIYSNAMGSFFEAPIIAQDLDPGLNQIFQGKDWISPSSVHYMKALVFVFLYVSLSCFFFGIILVLLLAMAMMAQLVAWLFFKISLRYLQAFRLLMVAATPMFFATMAFLTFYHLFFGLGILLLALLAVYFSFAVLSLKRESNKLVHM